MGTRRWQSCLSRTAPMCMRWINSGACVRARAHMRACMRVCVGKYERMHSSELCKRQRPKVPNRNRELLQLSRVPRDVWAHAVAHPSYFQHARRAEPTTWYSAVPPRGTRQYHHLVLGSTTTWYSAVPPLGTRQYQPLTLWIRSPVTICCNVMFASGERLFTGRAAGDRRRSPRCCSCTASTCTRRMCGGAFSSRVRPSALPRAHSVARVRSLAH